MGFCMTLAKEKTLAFKRLVVAKSFKNDEALHHS